MIFMVLYLFYHQEVNSRNEKERLAVGIEADSGTPGFGEGAKGTLPGGAMVIFVLLNPCKTGCCGQYNR